MDKSVESPKSRSASSTEEKQIRDAGESSDVDKRFDQMIKMFVESVEMKLIEMGKHFPDHIKVS